VERLVASYITAAAVVLTITRTLTFSSSLEYFSMSVIGIASFIFSTFSTSTLAQANYQLLVVKIMHSGTTASEFAGVPQTGQPI